MSESGGLLGSVTLAEETAADEAFLLHLFISVRGPEFLEAGLAPDQVKALLKDQLRIRTAYYLENLPNLASQIIVLGEERIGQLLIARPNHAVHLTDISLLPEYRNRGIGTFILGRVCNDADRNGEPVDLMVEQRSPAISLYERLGFETIATQGIHHKMVRQPKTVPGPG